MNLKMVRQYEEVLSVTVRAIISVDHKFIFLDIILINKAYIIIWMDYNITLRYDCHVREYLNRYLIMTNQLSVVTFIF